MFVSLRNRVKVRERSCFTNFKLTGQSDVDEEGFCDLFRIDCLSD